jgi:flagellar basal body-associated protein FliL
MIAKKKKRRIIILAVIIVIVLTAAGFVHGRHNLQGWRRFQTFYVNAGCYEIIQGKMQILII